MLQQLKEMVQNKAKLTMVPAENIASMKVGPMKFKISCYDIAGVGRMSLMEGTAMFGLMKMDTLMITPSLKDAPIISYDRILAMGNDTLIIEMYDTCEAHRDYVSLAQIKAGYAALPDRDPGEHWYDSMKCKESVSKKGKKITDKLDAFTMEYMTAYMNLVLASNDIVPSAKQVKNKEYVDGLLANGGPSTDQFIKAIGQEKTTELFGKYLFGTEQ